MYHPGKMTTRETSFREKNHPGKVTIRETTVYRPLHFMAHGGWSVIAVWRLKGVCLFHASLLCVCRRPCFLDLFSPFLFFCLAGSSSVSVRCPSTWNGFPMCRISGMILSTVVWCVRGIALTVISVTLFFILLLVHLQLHLHSTTQDWIFYRSVFLSLVFLCVFVHVPIMHIAESRVMACIRLSWLSIIFLACVKDL